MSALGDVIRRGFRLLDNQRIRFLLIGGINTVVSYCIFVLAQLTLGSVVGYLGSLLISFAIAVPIAFVLHRRFTFRVHLSGSLIVDFLRFASVYVVSLVINAVGLPLMVELGHVPPIPAQAIMTVVTTVISYVGHRYFSFRRSKSVGAHPAVDATNNIPVPDTASDGSSDT